jgi:hypothetical protein
MQLLCYTAFILSGQNLILLFLGNGVVFKRFLIGYFSCDIHEK